MSEIPEAVIVDAVRTPIGKAFKGALTAVRPDDLAGLAIKALLARVPEVEPATVDDVLVGCAVGRGEAGYNVARQAALLGGLPDSVPATTVNRFCASSLQAVRMAFHAIRAGEGDTFVVAGVESASRIRPEGGDGSIHNPRFVEESRPDFINHVYVPMGLTAENVARSHAISRPRMDEYALLSHRRAVAAQESGVTAAEIVPVPLPGGGLLETDESPRRSTDLEALAALPPAFDDDGAVTAGNSCPVNDGAAAVLVMSSVRARAEGLQPRARILASAVTGLAPEVMGLGPVEAVRRVLRRVGMSIDMIDVVELNEAFAAQVLACVDELGIDVERQLNPHGGAIALGHPYGMTGARILTSLLNDLETRDQTFGLETMCVGGGQGMAMVVERLA